MNTAIKTVLAVLLVGAAPAVATHALADNVTVGVTAPGIAFGYSDGYWDREHNWHAWKDRDEAEHFRTESHDHYYDSRHDADAKTMGWREADRWWDKRQ